jgi:CHAT domain-containing protein
MEKFYRAVQAGASFAEALKEAQLYLKQLTYRQALTALAGSPSSTDTSLESTPAFGGSPSLMINVTRSQTRSYLKGLQNDSSETPAAKLDPEARIFADPFYWAPFVLVGDDGVRSAGERGDR